MGHQEVYNDGEQAFGGFENQNQADSLAHYSNKAIASPFIKIPGGGK